MDWVTLTRQQVESDALPRICMVCGQPATCCVNTSFAHTPEWVQWLYLAGIIPGMIAEHFCRREMRVACPFCARHRHHWVVLVWTASVGWLLAGLLLGGAGFLIGMGVDAESSSGQWIGLGIGASVGIVLWLIVVIYLASTRIDATKVTTDDITLQRVADAFAKAARDGQPPAPA
jgi:hypothetical protein